MPFNLTPLGLPGCTLYATFEVYPFTTRLTSSQGAASVLLVLPNDRNLVGGRFYNQWLIVDAPANPLGIVFTNGGAALIGG